MRKEALTFIQSVPNQSSLLFKDVTAVEPTLATDGILCTQRAETGNQNAGNSLPVL